MHEAALPTLVVIRGNSGCGKSSVATALRERWGRGTAIVRQDVVRRDLLWEWDTPGAVNITLLQEICRTCLSSGYNVILEGTLCSDHYADMLRTLVGDHAGKSCVFYLDTSLETTQARHVDRDGEARFPSEKLRDWYRSRDVLGVAGETVLDNDGLALEDAVEAICGMVGSVDCLIANEAAEARFM